MRVSLILVLLAGSCVSDEAHRHYRQGLSAKRVEDVDVLFEKPDRPFQIIADFQARNATIDYMRREAAEVGADAVIVSRIGGTYDRGSTIRTTDQPSGFRVESTGAVGHLVGTAIKYE